MNEIIEIEFNSNNCNEIKSALKEIIDKENILNIKFTYNEIMRDAENVFDPIYWDQKEFFLFINLREIENKFFISKFPSISIIKNEQETSLTIMIDLNNFYSKNSNISDSIFNFSQNLAKRFLFSDYYAGLEPARDLETRIFTKNQPGPLSLS